MPALDTPPLEAERPQPVASDDPLVGTVVGERFQILEPLGSGRRASTYRAWHLVRGRTVAVKCLQPRVADRRRFRERFDLAGPRALKLRHPNLVPVLELERARNKFFLVQEDCPGHTLSRILEEEGPLDPERAARILVQVLDALDYLHGESLVHRGLTPRVVLVDPNDRVHVLGSGLLEATERVISLEGASYSSPEQAEGEPGDARADVYAAGVVLYEALSGQLPFTGFTAKELIRKRTEEDPCPLGAKAPDLSAQLDAIVMRALARDPGQRWQTAQELKLALQEQLGLEDRGESEPPAPPLPVLIAIGTGLVVLTVLLVVLLAVA